MKSVTKNIFVEDQSEGTFAEQLEHICCAVNHTLPIIHSRNLKRRFASNERFEVASVMGTVQYDIDGKAKGKQRPLYRASFYPLPIKGEKKGGNKSHTRTR